MSLEDSWLIESRRWETRLAKLRVDIPDGRYALYEHGVLKFFRFNWTQKGKPFFVELVGAPGGFQEYSVCGAHEHLLITLQRSGWQAAARRFAREIGLCQFCQSPLTNPVSRAVSAGPVCRERHDLDVEYGVLCTELEEYQDALIQRRKKFSLEASARYPDEPWTEHVLVHYVAKKVVLYYLYAVDWTLLYVGKSENGVGSRLLDHWSKEWGHDITYAIEVGKTRRTLADAERAEIHRLHPPGNLQCWECPRGVIDGEALPDNKLALKHSRLFTKGE